MGQPPSPGPENSALLRDIFGNPFRPVTFAPIWRTEAAVGIAAKMCDSRDFGNMPVLADALQDAGCEHADILSTAANPAPTSAGAGASIWCWARCEVVAVTAIAGSIVSAYAGVNITASPRWECRMTVTTLLA